MQSTINSIRHWIGPAPSDHGPCCGPANASDRYRNTRDLLRVKGFPDWTDSAGGCAREHLSSPEYLKTEPMERSTRNRLGSKKALSTEGLLHLVAKHHLVVAFAGAIARVQVLNDRRPASCVVRTTQDFQEERGDLFDHFKVRFPQTPNAQRDMICYASFTACFRFPGARCCFSLGSEIIDFQYQIPKLPNWQFDQALGGLRTVRSGDR